MVSSENLVNRASAVAISLCRPAPGGVRHTGRGAQYASARYGEVLAEQGLIGSMSRRGNPFDNAQAESFIRTFEAEAVYRMHYEILENVSADLPRFIEDVCNTRRFHCAPGYLQIPEPRLVQGPIRPSPCQSRGLILSTLRGVPQRIWARRASNLPTRHRVGS